MAARFRVGSNWSGGPDFRVRCRVSTTPPHYRGERAPRRPACPCPIYQSTEAANSQPCRPAPETRARYCMSHPIRPRSAEYVVPPNVRRSASPTPASAQDSAVGSGRTSRAASQSSPHEPHRQPETTLAVKRCTAAIAKEAPGLRVELSHRPGYTTGYRLVTKRGSPGKSQQPVVARILTQCDQVLGCESPCRTHQRLPVSAHTHPALNRSVVDG